MLEIFSLEINVIAVRFALETVIFKNLRSFIYQFFLVLMSSKKIEWSVLAQCDFFAVQKYVQTSDREAMKVVEPIQKLNFESKLQKNSLWKDAYALVCSAYEELTPQFSITHDNYGGYRLVYTGKEVIKTQTVIKRVPCGIVKAVPEGAVTELSIMSSERTGEQLVLLGPLRFVNSDCNPNCEFDFSSLSGIVQLRTKRRVKPGDEILVKYGPEFFELNECRCRTCEVNRKEEQRVVTAFEILLETEIKQIAEDFVDSTLEEVQAYKAQQEYNGRKKRRLRGRELVEEFNSLCDVPSDSPKKRRSVSELLPSFKLRPPSPMLESDSDDQSEQSVDDSSEYETSSNCQEETDATETSDEERNFCTSGEIKVSSPVSSLETLQCPVSTISEAESNTVIPKEEKVNSIKLFQGSETSVSDASVLVELFCSRFCLSDEASTSLHDLIRNVLPQDNVLPTGYSHIKQVKRNFEINTRFFEKSADASVCVFRYHFQLLDIVRLNITEIFNYAEIRKRCYHQDLKESVAPLVQVRSDHSLSINLNIFTDGVSIKKSTLKREHWPIWIQITDLPPLLRMSRKNIVLAALIVCHGIPNWEDIVPHLRAEVLCPFELHLSETVMLRVSFKFNLLVSDLGAKSHLLNMFKFNGFFGCHYCTAEGQTLGRTHAYYPFSQQGQIREPVLNDNYVDHAEFIGTENLFNVVGVKGKSAFASIVRNLPLSAPIDYMHCVLLGVLPDTLKICYRSLSPNDRKLIESEVKTLSCPREMISYSRKIRSLDEINQFKANELLNWLLYISFIVFIEKLPPKLYSHLTNLVFGIRLLIETSNEQSVSIAEKLLSSFCSEIVDIHGGNEKIETINVHSLLHLADQVRRFGHLFSYSAMSFESANRSLSEVFTGSTSECEVICRRLLHRHKLMQAGVDNNRLQRLFNQFSRSDNADSKTFAESMVETDAVKDARKQYKDATILNRQIFNGVYFDSLAFGRSKHGNCYVYYVENGAEILGEIQYFLKNPGVPFFNEVQANVLAYDVLEQLGPVKNVVYRTLRTTEENLVPVADLKKMFCFKKLGDEECQTFMIKLCQTFEHS